MSAATASSTRQSVVYVRLLEEGVRVWRPVTAHQVGAATYELAPGPVPVDESWSFQPGDIVVAELRRKGSEEEVLVAVARATDFDEPSSSTRVLAG